jgi:hypothetical protein
LLPGKEKKYQHEEVFLKKLNEWKKKMYRYNQMFGFIKIRV